MSCYPSYPYTPAFTESSASCFAPSYELHRSRLSVTPSGMLATPLFFRSKDQNNESNLIEVELVDTPTPQLRIIFDGSVVKTYAVSLGAGGIAGLRMLIQATDPNPYIEMPSVGVDKYDTRTIEDDGDGTTASGIAPFVRTALTGGVGAPSDASSLAAIRTGPTRTIYIVKSLEDVMGEDIFPPASQRIQQWNGSSYISYCNNIQGSCPGEGTC